MNICDDVFNSNMARGEDVEKQVTQLLLCEHRELENFVTICD